MAESSLAAQHDTGSKIKNVGRSLDQAYHDATSIMKSGRFTLYSTIITNNERYHNIEKKLGEGTQASSYFGAGWSTDIVDYIGRKHQSIRHSPNISAHPSVQVAKDQRWGKGGFLSSNKHLWPRTSQLDASKVKDELASKLYLPVTLRHKDHAY